MPIWLDPDLASDVEAFAQRIVGKSTDAGVLESARRVAEAEIDLRRLRSHRNRLMDCVMVDSKVQTEAVEPAPFALAAARIESNDRRRSLRTDPFEAKVSALVAEFAKTLAALDRSMPPAKPSLAERTKELAALDRYERRALSRRKFAIRAFDLVRIEAERRARDAGAASFGGAGKGD